jgi:hypothetical protein
MPLRESFLNPPCVNAEAFAKRLHSRGVSIFLVRQSGTHTLVDWHLICASETRVMGLTGHF